MRTLLTLLLLLFSVLTSAKAAFRVNYAAKALYWLQQSAVKVNESRPDVSTIAKNKRSELLFIENNGQLADANGNRRPEILFTAKSAGLQLYITANRIVYIMRAAEPLAINKSVATPAENLQNRLVPEPVKYKTHTFSVELIGSSPNAKLIKQEPQQYYEKHYKAHCPEGITANSYKQFTLKDVYPGIDWVVYSNGLTLKYDFKLAKASDASKIKLKVNDASASIGLDGQLVLQTTLGQVTEDKPISIQDDKQLESEFVSLGHQTFGFKVKDADPLKPLTIDPVVLWSTYFGGSADEFGNSCIANANGEVFMVGVTRSTDLPRMGGFQWFFEGVEDVFIVKFATDGFPLLGTYYGGIARDIASFCTLDPSGNLIVTGWTESTSFPILGAFQSSFAGGTDDAFIIKLDPTGSRIWATYFGGSGSDQGFSAASDQSGNIYSTGNSTSINLPVNGGVQPVNAGFSDAYLLKFSSSGQRIWATYYGGSGPENGWACSVDRAGDVYISGYTASNNFPVRAAFQATASGNDDGFITKFNSSGAVSWSTYFGGSSFDNFLSSTTDANGDIYLSGITGSANIPVANAYQPAISGPSDALIVKFSGSGSRIWATYFGGSGGEDGASCNMMSNGDLLVSGGTSSANMPLLDAVQSSLSGPTDAYIIRLSPSCNLIWSTFYGGTNRERGFCTSDNSGSIYLAGSTTSTDLFLSGNNQQQFAGNQETFIAKFHCMMTPEISIMGNSNLCSGQVVRLDAPIGLRYLWSTGDTTRSITVSTAGRYTVRSVAGNCTSLLSSSVNIRYYPKPPTPGIKTDDTLLCIDDLDFKRYTIINYDPRLVYVWVLRGGFPISFDSTSTVVSWLRNAPIRRISSVVRDRNGCWGDTTTIDVRVDSTSLECGGPLPPQAALFIPNVVTPNNDGQNDQFALANVSLNSQVSLTVINRYGQTVYEASKYDNKWSGEGLPAGTYYIMIKLATEPPSTYRGWIQLLK